MYDKAKVVKTYTARLQLVIKKQAHRLITDEFET